MALLMARPRSAVRPQLPCLAKGQCCVVFEHKGMLQATLQLNANQVIRPIEGPDKNKHWLTFSRRFSPHATAQKERSTVIMNDVPLCTTLRERTAAGTREGFQSLSWSGIGLFVPARTGSSACQQQRTLPYAK